MAKHAHVEEYEAQKEGALVKKSLAKAIMSKMQVEKHANHEIAELKHDYSVKEDHHLHLLKKLAQTRIHAMARATQRIAKQLFEAKDTIKADNSRIKYLKSKIVLMERQYARQSDELASSIEKKESRFWNQQMTNEEKQAEKQRVELQSQLSHAQN